MGQTHKYIEVNGKRYDAVTGAIVSGGRSHASPAKALHARQKASPRSIDGFGAPVNRDHMPRHAKPAAVVHKPTPAAYKPLAPKPIASRIEAPVRHVAHHRPQRAATLMRTAVKKPAIKSAEVIKAQTRTDLLAKKPSQLVVAKHSYGSLNKFRHQRAARLLQSPAVSHFAEPEPAPAAHRPAGTHGSLDFIATSTTPRPAASTLVKTQHHTAPATQRSSSNDIFEQALATATSHEQVFDAVKPLKTRKRKRALSFVVVSFVLLLLVGFFGYQNSDQINLKVASYRSGLHAKLPAYSPDNFAFQSLDYKPGAVTVSYASETGDQQYNISQKASNWDSQALYSNVVSSARDTYKTYQRAGRTVYVMGNNSATWVDSGIWYTVDGNAALSSNQLLDLVSSM